MARCYAHVSAPTRAFGLHLTTASRAGRYRSAGRRIRAGEAAQRVRLLQHDGPVAHLDPAAPLETAERRVDALPGAPGLMRQFLLAHPGPDDAVVAPGLAEQ